MTMCFARPHHCHRPRAGDRVRGIAALGVVGVLAVVTACTDAGVDGAGPSGSANNQDAGEQGARAQSPAGPPAGDADRGGADALAAKLEPCPPDDPDATPVEDADGLPEETLSCLGDDDTVSLAGLRGEPTVINVWATWCGPCREEAPYLQRVHERAGDRLRVLGVNYEDPPPEHALAFADELGLRYAQLADPDGELREPLRLNAGIPVTVFVDANGRVVHRAHKPYRDVEELTSDIADHLEVDL